MAYIFLFRFFIILPTVYSLTQAEVSSPLDEDVLSRFSAVFATNGSDVNSSRPMMESTLGDPGGCIYSCWNEEKDASQRAADENSDRVIAMILLTIAANPNFTKSDSLSLSPELERISIENMGPMFEQLCLISRQAHFCYSLCEPSQLRNVTLAMHNTDIFCEPVKNWHNFSDCYNAFACINRTLTKSTCYQKCGREMNIGDYVRLQLRNTTTHPFVLQTSADLNNETGQICRSTNCHVDCNKPDIVTQCGIREYGLYLRLRKYDIQSLLTVGREMKKIDTRSMQKCQRFF